MASPAPSAPPPREASPASPEPTSTPKPFPSMLPLEEKSLPPPPLDQILDEMPSVPKSPRQFEGRDSSETFVARSLLERKASSRSAARGRTSSESASVGSPRAEEFQTPQLYPTRSMPSPLPSPRHLHDLDASPQREKFYDQQRRRRKDSRSSRSSSNASSHHVPMPIHELPDPSTFPIPPSPGLPYDSASPAFAAAISAHNSSRHLSSDVSSGYSHSTRGSTWSSYRCSRNSSWDTHNSSPCSTSIRHQSLKDGSSTQSSSVETALPSSFDTAASSLTGEGDEANDEDDVGLGITSELQCVRSSRIAVVAPSESPQAAPGRWAHHRNPSWALKSFSQDAGTAAQDPAAGPVLREDDINTEHRQRPLMSRAMSTTNIAGDGAPSVAAATASVTAAAVTPLHLRTARSRAYSAVSSAEHQPSTRTSVGSSSDENGPARSVHSPVPFNPRTSSLKKSMRSDAARSATPATLRSVHRTAGIAPNGLLPLGSHRSSIRSVEELVEDDQNSTRSSVLSSDAFPSRHIPKSHQRSASVASSVLSLDVSALAFEFPHALGTSSPEVGNAVKFVESGRGNVVEANGRRLDEFEDEIGPHTTHLILAGCKGDDLVSFLNRAVAKTAHGLLVLDVSNAGLASVPACVSQCSQLEELNLSCNPLGRTTLPSWLGCLTHLRVLAMDETELTTIPYSVSQLSELKALSVRRNKLTHLPSWLHLLKNLERLYVDNNPFKGPWLRVIASILPKQVQYLPPQAEIQSSQPPASAPPLSDHSQSPSVSPVSERGPPRRRPFLQRMRSDNDFRAGSHFDPSISPKTVLSAMPQDGLGSVTGPSPKQIEEHMHRRGLVGMEGATEGPSDSKWGFLRKVARKSSHGKSLAQLAASSAGDSSSAASIANSGSTSPVAHRLPMTADARTLPKINTNSLRMTRGSRSGSVVSGLGAPFQPTPVAVPAREEQQQGDTADASRELSSRASKRMSFLPLQSGGTGTNQPTASRPAPLSQPSEEDAEDEKRRLHALMCYLRDLDDLSPQTVARRSRLPSGSFASGLAQDGISSLEQDRINASPIRRRPSGMLLSSSASPTQPTDIKDDSNRRRRIVQEVISSEESYIRGLQELVDIYVKPARKAVDGANGQPVLAPAEHRTIFGNVEGLLQFHNGAFLPSLKLAAKDIILKPEHGNAEGSDAADDAALTAKAAEAVAGVFTKHAAFFRMYSTYINGCDEAQARITALLTPSAATSSTATSLMTPLTSSSASGADAAKDGVSNSQRKKFKAFMKKCRLDARHSQLNVESYLLLPVQRIPRYELLLKDLARSTDPKHLEKASSVSAALREISAIAASVNESKRQSEQDRKLLAWQARMRGPVANPLVQPHRRLIRDGSLVVRRVVNRMHAFDTTVASVDDALCDGAFAASSSSSSATSPVSEAGPASEGGGLAFTNKTVDCLRQSSPNQQVTLLLCNDCCITLRDALPSNGIPTVGSDSRGVELYSLMQWGGNQTPSPPRCTVVGGTTLRMVDAHCVYYFATQSPHEAQSWCQSINGAGIEVA